MQAILVSTMRTSSWVAPAMGDRRFEGAGFTPLSKTSGTRCGPSTRSWLRRCTAMWLNRVRTEPAESWRSHPKFIATIRMSAIAFVSRRDDYSHRAAKGHPSTTLGPYAAGGADMNRLDVCCGSRLTLDWQQRLGALYEFVLFLSANY